MMEILAAVGLTCILKYGSILDFIRRPLTRINYFAELFGCSLCLGFWSGVLVAVYIYMTTGIINPYIAFVAAAASWLFDTILGTLQAIEASFAPPHEDD